MRGTLGSFARTFHAHGRTSPTARLLAAGLTLLAFAALPGAAGATVVQENGALDASAYNDPGRIFTEGVGGISKFAWVVDRQSGEDVLRGYDQTLGSNSPLATVSGSAFGGPGAFGEIVGVAFAPNQSRLFVLDRANNRLTMLPRNDDGGPGDPVDYLNSVSVNSFGYVDFPIDDPRGLAIDPRGSGIGYLSTYWSNTGGRGVLKFNPNPSGSTFTWTNFTWLPGAWSGSNGPGAMTVDAANGNLYVAIDGTSTIQGYQADMAGLAGDFTSPSSGNYISLYADNNANRLLGVKADSIDVFSLRTARLLGSVDGIDFGNGIGGFAGVNNYQQFFLSTTGAQDVRSMWGNPNPTCVDADPIVATAGEPLVFTPDCTDDDSSAVQEFEITGPPEIGSATTINGDSQIQYTPPAGYEGNEIISFRVTTQDGRSVGHDQPIEIVPPDTQAPSVTIDSPADGSVSTDPSVTIHYTVSDDTDPNPTCNIADGASVSLEVGSNQLAVSCSDASGNTGAAQVAVSYDAAPPQVEISDPTDGDVTYNDFTVVNFSVSDDADPEPGCTRVSGQNASLVEGANTISVSCTDAAGRTGSDSVTIYSDRTAPEITIDSPADGSTITDPTPVVEYTATDAIDDAPSCDSFYIPDGFVLDSESGGADSLEPGANRILVECHDHAYNFSQAWVDLIYDAAAPVVGITAPASGSVVSTATPALSYTVSDDTDPAPSCTPAAGSALSLALGVNTVAVTCTDAAGRVGSDSASVTYTPPVNSLSQPVVRETTNLEPTSGDVLIKLPGSDEWIPIEQAVNIPLGTIIDARNGHAKVTLANQDGSTYQSEFWGGIFQVFQMTGDNPVALIKLRDDVAPNADASSASIPRAGVSPFRGAQITKRRKKNGLWGSGHGKFRTSGSGGSATVRGTIWYVADYEGGTLFKVARGVVEVRPVHGNCFDLHAGESKFIEYTPPKKKPGGGPPKKKKKKKGCELS